jgi:BlaI family transcriptional regulator, penicillinase repressor
MLSCNKDGFIFCCCDICCDKGFMPSAGGLIPSACLTKPAYGCKLVLRITLVSIRRGDDMTNAEKISDAELEVLKILWANESPLSERQIIEALTKENNWHRATIQTLVRRLCEKGAVQKVKKEIFYFSALISEADYAKERTRDLLNKVYGGSAKNLVSAMLTNDILSEKDMEELKSYWRERRNEK